MHRVVIIGAGFGGLSAARSLAGKPVDVTIIDQRNFHTFQPLLYEVSTAGLDPGDVAYPIRAIFGRVPNVTFRYGTVNGVDWANKTVGLDEEESIAFDSLIVASGATVKYFGIPGAAQYAHALYTLADARYLRDHILRRLEEVDADPRLAKDALTFVVIGGGPTGVEVAGALAELLDVSVRHDGFRFDRSQARIILVDGLDRLLSPFAPPASRYTAATLANRGVDLRLGRMVNEVTEDCVALDDGTTIACRTVVWAGGVTVEGTIAAQITATGGPNGRLVVEPDLSL
ncbi:MAG TPA: NAD(P)/FAD-dependent oxidoreductase, partial [Acidimicrobiales bacterium]|nr:NAD(P)/FAD-dependent oxidoreductase [Acidimicrobiales bacterium]